MLLTSCDTLADDFNFIVIVVAIIIDIAIVLLLAQFVNIVRYCCPI